MLTIHYTTDAVTMAKKEKEKTQYKTKDRATRTPTKHRSELGCSGRVGSSCSTRGTCHANKCLAITTVLLFVFVSG
jgi:hypothetical protein